MAAFAWGCAGELDADPQSFKNAYSPPGTITGGTTGSGGTATTGGTVGMTGGTASGGTTSTGGATGTGGSADVIPPDDACVATVFSSNACTACHSVGAAATIGAGLVLEGTDLGKRLVTTKATYKDVANMAACVPGALIIDPAMPSNSILLKKVAGTQACGEKMPQGSGLSGANLQCITDWINKF